MWHTTVHHRDDAVEGLQDALACRAVSRSDAQDGRPTVNSSLASTEDSALSVRRFQSGDVIDLSLNMDQDPFLFLLLALFVYNLYPS